MQHSGVDTKLAKLKQTAIAYGTEQFVELHSEAVLALVECAEALKELSSMYARTWDRVDGALVMFNETTPRFEAAHAAAHDALAKLEAL